MTVEFIAGTVVAVAERSDAGRSSDTAARSARLTRLLVTCDAGEVLATLDQSGAATGCPVHRTPLRRVDADAARCPRCGTRLAESMEGMWD